MFRIQCLGYSPSPPRRLVVRLPLCKICRRSVPNVGKPHWEWRDFVSVKRLFRGLNGFRSLMLRWLMGQTWPTVTSFGPGSLTDRMSLDNRRTWRPTNSKLKRISLIPRGVDVFLTSGVYKQRQGGHRPRRPRCRPCLLREHLGQDIPLFSLRPRTLPSLRRYRSRLIYNGNPSHVLVSRMNVHLKESF